MARLEPGRLVTSSAGRDSGQCYLVYRRLDDDFVLVVDGVRRTQQRPKRKNRKHLIPHAFVADSLAACWKQNELVAETRIREAMQVLVSKVEEAG